MNTESFTADTKTKPLYIYTMHPLRVFGRALFNVFIVLTGAYGLNLTLLLILRLLVGEQWTVIALVNSFLHLMLMPPLILLPICLLLRRWRLALTLAPAVLVFLLSYGVLFLPRTVRAIPDTVSFSVLTYNLHIEKHVFEPMINLIREADADVVAFQELSRLASERFAVELSDLYPYRAFHLSNRSSSWGQGILSRYPIVSDEYWHINLGHQRVEVLVQNRRVTLYNTHPAHLFRLTDETGIDTQSRDVEINTLLDRATQDDGALIILGDFNMSDQSEDYQRLTALYTDVYREVGWGMGFTFPDFSQPQSRPTALRDRNLSIQPFVRLDYIFHNEGVQALEALVWPTSGGSDHRPVYARLALLTPQL
jgi:endonuclease/exonuclease/phosphatase (EEP) superfamily protein YafD